MKIQSDIMQTEWIKPTIIIENGFKKKKYDNTGVRYCHHGHNSFNSFTQITNYTVRNCSFMRLKRVVSTNKNQTSSRE